MQVKLEKCNNIESGSVELMESTLNLKYAVNGSGKTTIARAILASIRERLGTDKNALAGLTPFNRPLKKCSSNAPGSWISKKRVVQTRLRSECEGHFGLFAGRFARFGRTYPMAHA